MVVLLQRESWRWRPWPPAQHPPLLSWAPQQQLCPAAPAIEVAGGLNVLFLLAESRTRRVEAKLWSYVLTTAGICWETLAAATLSLVGFTIGFLIWMNSGSWRNCDEGEGGCWEDFEVRFRSWMDSFGSSTLQSFEAGICVVEVKRGQFEPAARVVEVYGNGNLQQCMSYLKSLCWRHGRFVSETEHCLKTHSTNSLPVCLSVCLASKFAQTSLQRLGLGGWGEDERGFWGGFEAFSELDGLLWNLHFEELRGRDLCGVSGRLGLACSENYWVSRKRQYKKKQCMSELILNLEAMV